MYPIGTDYKGRGSAPFLVSKNQTELKRVTIMVSRQHCLHEQEQSRKYDR